MLIIIILVVLILGYGGHRFGESSYPGYGPGFGVGTILLILLILYMLGFLRR